MSVISSPRVAPFMTSACSPESNTSFSGCISAQDQYTVFALRLQEALVTKPRQSSAHCSSHRDGVTKDSSSSTLPTGKSAKIAKLCPKPLIIMVPEPAKRTYDLSCSYTVQTEAYPYPQESDPYQTARSVAQHRGISPECVRWASWKDDKLTVEVESFEDATTLAGDDSMILYQDVSYRWDD